MDAFQDTTTKPKGSPSTQILQSIFLVILITTILDSNLNLILAVSICSAWLTQSITRSDNQLIQSLLLHYVDRAEERRTQRRDLLARTLEGVVTDLVIDTGTEREMKDVAIQTDLVIADQNERKEEQEQEQEPAIEPIKEEEIKEESVVSIIEEPDSDSNSDSVSEPEPEPEPGFLARSPSVSTVYSQASIRSQIQTPVQASTRILVPTTAPWVNLVPAYEPLQEPSCIGKTLKGTRCGQSFISYISKQEAQSILERMRSNDPGDTFEFESLLRLANCMLCPRWHRDRKPQGPQIAQMWYSQLAPARAYLQQYWTPPSLLSNTITPPSSSYSPQTPVYSHATSPSSQLQITLGSPNAAMILSSPGSSLNERSTTAIGSTKSVKRNLMPQFQSMKNG